MSLVEQIQYESVHDPRQVDVLLAAEIETLKRKVEQLEKFLPHHLRAPTVPPVEIDDTGRL